ncbi:MAG: response regulator [Bacteroidales bacterium]|nr:response regulator [Bacteroidales bacterium]
MYTSIANHGLTVKDKLIENYYILNQIVQSIDTGIAIFYEKQLVHVNNEIRRMTGRTYKYLESNLIDIISPTDLYKIKRKFIGVLKHICEKADFYFNIIMPDGNTKTLRCKFTLVRIVEKNGVFAMVHEVSKAELDALNHSDEVYSNVAHELRSPLNAIIGFSNILDDDSLSGADRAQYLTYIRNSCKSLLLLLDDFSDFNKLKHNKIQIEESLFDIESMFDELKQWSLIFRSECNKTEDLNIVCVKPQVPSSRMITGDPQRIKQILINLLSNAIKFTEKGSVSFSYELSANTLEFVVKDTGIGIPNNMLIKIFDRFTQIGAIKSNSGLGLGLAITKNLVELMNGTIEVKSHEGEGSEFIIRLPLKRVSQPSPAASVSVSQDFVFSGKKILIAEDARINYILLEKILSKTGATILWAQNGEECVSLFEQNRDTGVILMDMQMPVKDGYAAAREILAIDSTMPIVAQTAFSMDDERERILNTGCVDYIAKPIDRIELLKKIASVIR